MEPLKRVNSASDQERDSAPDPKDPSGSDVAHGGAASERPDSERVDSARPEAADLHPSQDPIFQQEEAGSAAGGSKNTVLLWQFFLFPLMIVAVVVGIAVLLRVFTGDLPTPEELLTTLQTGGDNEKQQAAQQLANAIATERIRYDRGLLGEEPPFFAHPVFRKGLRDALGQALRDDSDEELARVQWLCFAIGRAQDPDGVETLAGILFPDAGEGGRAREFPPAVRLAAVQGLAFMEHRMAEPALVAAAQDASDAQVRAVAVNALALLGLPQHGGAEADGPRVVSVLQSALTDDLPGVRLNAAIGLALRGDDRGAAILERALTRTGLAEMKIEERWIPSALRNAILAAERLRKPAHRPLVEALSKRENEGDERVRQRALEALERWTDAG